MKDKIIQDILSLEKGEEFSISQYLKKYNITDKKSHISLTLEVIRELGDEIEVKGKAKDGLVPISGLPQNMIYLRK